MPMMTSLLKLSKSFALPLLAVGSLALVACGGPPEPKLAMVKARPMPEGQEWNGVYYSKTYGFLHLLEEGDTATGAWRTTAGDSWGDLSGKLDGNLFKYGWTEYRIGAVGADAKRTGKGYFVYQTPKGTEPAEIKGQWGLGEDETGNPWDAIKQANMKPDPDSVKPDEVEGRVNAGGWDDEEGGSAPSDEGEGESEDSSGGGEEEEGGATEGGGE
jgi:hypothetical protein